MLATIYSQVKCVKCLIKAGAELELIDDYRATALKYAESRFYVEIAGILETAIKEK
jgi:hypothetical protein